MSKTLIIRLSAFGDVAMLIPAICSVADQYPSDQFSVLTKKPFAPLFIDLRDNIDVIAFDSQEKDKGLIGLFKLAIKLSQMGYTHVADEHDVLRSKIIRNILRLKQIKIKTFDKGRKDKEQLIATKKITPPLKSTIERYKNCLNELGFQFNLTFTDFYEKKSRNFGEIEAFTGAKTTDWIGIAPFAKHKGKIYPIYLMEKVIEIINNSNQFTVFLFGNGEKELKVFDEWRTKYKCIADTSGKLNLQKELLLMSYLDVMVSMDSANMHLASLVGTPVVSIWGATHPSLGFYGFNQNMANAIQLNMSCRPCSVFGNKPCERKDYACLKRIDPIHVYQKIEEVIQSTSKK